MAHSHRKYLKAADCTQNQDDSIKATALQLAVIQQVGDAEDSEDAGSARRPKRDLTVGEVLRMQAREGEQKRI